MRKLYYLGMDSCNRPVYVDRETGKLWIDTDPRAHVPASLYSTVCNELDGEPDHPIQEHFKLYPKRKTW